MASPQKSRKKPKRRDFGELSRVAHCGLGRSAGLITGLISLAHRHSALPDSPEDNRFGSAGWRFLAGWWSSA